MHIRSRPSWHISENDVTSETSYLNRRQIVAAMGLAGLGMAVGGMPALAQGKERELAKLDTFKGPYQWHEDPTPYEAITTYNNFYEFGVGKDDPARNAWRLEPKPWTVKVSGLAEKTGDYAYEDLIKPHQLEERIYRFRCVEAWSMVVPWVGIPLRSVIEQLQPSADAKYVAFQTLNDKEQMPGLRWPVLDWPYVEGLRMDEAMHPLTMLVVGLYGKELPNQNGAPIRLIVPWKYGFKSIKSIVGINFVKNQPPTSWNKSAPREYGFYSNVNPSVPHPRWSQATERRIGGGIFSQFQRIETLPFNGYADEVASLYKGMDLRKFY